MLEKTAQLLKVLKEAIQVESDGYNFYMVAAEKTEDPKGKRVWSSLAQDELDHGSMLKGLYQSIKDKSGYKLERKRRRYAPYGAYQRKKKPKSRSKSPIFSVEFKKKIKEGHFALCALRIAQLLEKNSISFYGKNAKKSKHPELKSLFNFLVEWEKDHLKTLVEQENFLAGKI
jgi:rubrerythrin